MDFQRATQAQQWARSRNFYLLRLKGARSIVNIPDCLHDKGLHLLVSHVDIAIKEMIARIEQLNPSYKHRIKKEPK